MSVEYSRNSIAWEEFVQAVARVAEGALPVALDAARIYTGDPMGWAALAKDFGSIMKKVGDDRTKAMSARTLDEGVRKLVMTSDRMSQILEKGLSASVAKLGEVSGAIDALRSDFHWGLGAVVWQLEEQNETLKAILKTLQAPLDTQAKELRARAEFAYRQRWYDDALKDLLASEEKNRYDFAVHQLVGNIYLYHVRPANLDKALEYYLKAAKYAAPHSLYHTALAHMFTAFVHYLKGQDNDAIEQARRASDIRPAFLIASYSHAKFAAAAKRADVAIPSLERVIRADAGFAVKVCLDPDFVTIEAAVVTLLERLRAEAKHLVEGSWSALCDTLDGYVLPAEPRESLTVLREEVVALIAQGTYLDYVALPAKICELEAKVAALKLPQRDGARSEASAMLASVRAGLDDHISSNTLRKHFVAMLERGERALAESTTYEAAERALDVAKEVAREWVDVARYGLVRAVFTGGHTNWVRAIAFSPNGALLASASDDGKANVWDVGTASVIHTFSEANDHGAVAVTFAPHGARLIVGFDNGNIVFANTTQTGSQNPVLRTITMWKNESALSFAFARATSIVHGPGGAVLAIATDDGKIRLYDAGMAHLDDATPWAVIKKEGIEFKAIAFSGDGKTLASGSSDGDVRLWGFSGVHSLGKHEAGVNTVVFDREGGLLATGSDDSTIRIWDVRERRCRAVLRGHRHDVRSIAFSPDGHTLVSGGSDEQIRLWDVASGEEKAVIKASCVVCTVTYDPTGTMLAYAGSDHKIHLRDIVVRKVEAPIVKG
ncbi:MAG: hypothetical protein IPM54_17635 [Polyangiaceae bacterium]|nr:hypothetical protein [Polyangiaceae bacterium]